MSQPNCMIRFFYTLICIFDLISYYYRSNMLTKTSFNHHQQRKISKNWTSGTICSLSPASPVVSFHCQPSFIEYRSGWRLLVTRMSPFQVPYQTILKPSSHPTSRYQYLIPSPDQYCELVRQDLKQKMLISMVKLVMSFNKSVEKSLESGVPLSRRMIKPTQSVFPKRLPSHVY